MNLSQQQQNNNNNNNDQLPSYTASMPNSNRDPITGKWVPRMGPNAAKRQSLLIEQVTVNTILNTRESSVHHQQQQQNQQQYQQQQSNSNQDDSDARVRRKSR
jgi:hypothetical protein